MISFDGSTRMTAAGGHVLGWVTDVDGDRVPFELRNAQTLGTRMEKEIISLTTLLHSRYDFYMSMTDGCWMFLPSDEDTGKRRVVKLDLIGSLIFIPWYKAVRISPLDDVVSAAFSAGASSQCCSADGSTVSGGVGNTAGTGNKEAELNFNKKS